MRTYSNNNNHSADNNRNRLRWMALIAVVLVLITASIFLIVKSNHQSNFPRADQEHNTTYQGMSAFINNGLTTSQVNGLIKAFSKFSPKAKNITVYPNSLSPGPHDPNKINPFTVSFSLAIDSTSYKGLVSYSDLSSIHLILYTLSGKQVFDSGVISAQ